MDQRTPSSLVPGILSGALAIAALGFGVALYAHWNPWAELCQIPSQVAWAKFSRDERTVATSEYWGTEFDLWDARTGASLGSLKAPKDCDPVTVSPDLDRLIYKDGDDLYLSFPSGAPVKLDAGDPDQIGFSPDGSVVTTFSTNSRGIRVWDARTGGLVRVLSDKSSYGGVVLPDGRSLLTHDPLEDGRSALVLRTFPDGVEKWSVPYPALDTRFSVSPDGTKFLIARLRETAKIYSTADGSLLKELPLKIGAGVFLPDSNLLLCGHGGSPCKSGDLFGVVNAETGAVAFKPDWKRGGPGAVAVSRSGRYLIVGHFNPGGTGATILVRRRPEHLWGIARMWEFWGLVTAVLGAMILGFARASLAHRTGVPARPADGDRRRSSERTVFKTNDN